jgi:beta-alanine degradation protein BauB
MSSHFDLLANDSVFRVIRWTIEPGGSIPLHTHEFDYVVVPLVDATMRAVSADGVETQVSLEVGSSYTRSAGVHHEVFNDGTTPIVFIEIEHIGQQ